MKKFSIGVLFLVISFALSAQTWVTVSGNKKYTGLAEFQQGTTITLANFSITGNGDTLRINTAGDSCRIYATNQISFVSPTVFNSAATFKSTATAVSLTTALLQVPGAGDTLKILSAGDSTKVTSTNKISVGTTTYHNAPLIMKAYFTPYTADSATISTDIFAGTPPTGATIYCSDCQAADGSTGVLRTYNSSAWKRHW